MPTPLRVHVLYGSAWGYTQRFEELAEVVHQTAAVRYFAQKIRLNKNHLWLSMQWWGNLRSQIQVLFSVWIALAINIPFNLHPANWFEGYPVKSTQSTNTFTCKYLIKMSHCASKQGELSNNRHWSKSGSENGFWGVFQWNPNILYGKILINL